MKYKYSLFINYLEEKHEGEWVTFVLSQVHEYKSHPGVVKRMFVFDPRACFLWQRSVLLPDVVANVGPLRFMGVSSLIKAQYSLHICWCAASTLGCGWSL